MIVVCLQPVARFARELDPESGRRSLHLSPLAPWLDFDLVTAGEMAALAALEHSLRGGEAARRTPRVWLTG
jgi:hypothetical protein